MSSLASVLQEELFGVQKYLWTADGSTERLIQETLDSLENQLQHRLCEAPLVFLRKLITLCYILLYVLGLNERIVMPGSLFKDHWQRKFPSLRRIKMSNISMRHLFQSILPRTPTGPPPPPLVFFYYLDSDGDKIKIHLWQ